MHTKKQHCIIHIFTIYYTISLYICTYMYSNNNNNNICINTRLFILALPETRKAIFTPHSLQSSVFAELRFQISLVS